MHSCRTVFGGSIGRNLLQISVQRGSADGTDMGVEDNELCCEVKVRSTNAFALHPVTARRLPIVDCG